jgi:RecA/RadA recombinase
MAKKSADLHLVEGDEEDFTAALISAINKEHGERVAYNLAFDESPTHVKRWIGTGSTQLDYAIRNAAGGGYPEGRVI